MNKLVVWGGTPDEFRELSTAISHNCECEFSLMNIRVKTCAPHKAVTEDQRFCDGLIYARRYWAVHRQDGKDAPKEVT